MGGGCLGRLSPIMEGAEGMPGEVQRERSHAGRALDVSGIKTGVFTR